MHISFFSFATRYRVEMNMLDVYDSVLVGFDDEMSKLTNVHDAGISKLMVAVVKSPIYYEILIASCCTGRWTGRLT